MVDSPENTNRNRLVAAGIGVSGVAAVAGGILAARHRIIRPEDLNDTKAVSMKRGAVILTASALALRMGESVTFADMQELTSLSRQNTSWGVNFLIERGLADRELGARNQNVADQIWAAEALMNAANSPKDFPLLHLHMGLLATQ